MLEKDIENAIKGTLVVTNKESIKYAVSRIIKLIEDGKSEIKMGN